MYLFILSGLTQLLHGIQVEKPKKKKKAGDRGICLSLYSRLWLTAGIIKEFYPILSALVTVWSVARTLKCSCFFSFDFSFFLAELFELLL